jgi:hypothetical protein
MKHELLISWLEWPAKRIVSFAVVILATAAFISAIGFFGGTPIATANEPGPTEAQLRETNVQLKRIADALEVIAGTGSRQWKGHTK